MWKLLSKIDQDNSLQFSGKWKTNKNKPQDSICNCIRIGNLKQNYVGCPLGSNCFIWNDSDAKNICPQICDKYLSKRNSEWTGNWKSTSAQSSACECKYY